MIKNSLIHPPVVPLSFLAIIVAAGKAERFGGQIPKQYQNLAGKPVLAHSLDLFLAQQDCKGIILVLNPDHENLYQESIHKTLPAEKRDLIKIIHGGQTRQDSVKNAMQFLDKNIDAAAKTIPILVHDAARPCITEKNIQEIVLAVYNSGAATLACPIVDTLRKNDQIIDRTDVWAMMTPQAARFEWLYNAHMKYAHTNIYTDDTALLTAAGHHVKFVECARTNIKITTQSDMEIAEMFINRPHARRTIRIGNGFDVHAFDQNSAGPLRIGGIDIPYNYKLSGHSDADVVLHAINDALYGTIASGDIGSHFPPSDVQWKGKDSAFFLQQAVNDIKNANGIIAHIDVTIICEQPKIGPHREEMRMRIAEIMNLPLRSISVKATTTEKLGFTGRGEGIAAQVTATVEFAE